ncbi:TauD/TfdA family dioxygenase [Ilumatobacter nonamiensis]|uniref:TauD/TfdA family dioxygenase n=1 Tax=Ilumatobacter nonamiensis TaxID=467093 RepID=UPI0003473E90|nr:TauD/TfdA family dioxygenase [Ilumatobacter nonamiensis]
MILTPDFADHGWHPLVRAELTEGIVRIAWSDGLEFDCHPLWLYEQTVGIEPRTREGTIEPGRLPDPEDLLGAGVTGDGALALSWSAEPDVRVHPGWLRHIADGAHLPTAATGEPAEWTTATMADLPTFDGSAVLDDDAVLEAWLASLCTLGVGRLRGCPATEEWMGEVAARIGPIRGSNFGGVFTVESIVEPDSTANTGLALGQHTDLPTRETPPGFQFLHCVENTVSGGLSRMADGLAVVAELRDHHRDAYASLTTDEWVFANRAIDGDHRWVGPIIDLGGPRSPLTLRAFYPVRLAPHMPLANQQRAYDAMRTFSQVAHDPRFMITSAFQPGDLVGFDNRRILHGRDAFDATAGRRRLRGCYIDHDDLYSRLRVLRRPGAARSAPTSPTSRRITT